jgi:hypothetical protein
MKNIKIFILLVLFIGAKQIEQNDKVCFVIDGLEGVIFLTGGDMGLDLDAEGYERANTSVKEVLKVDSLAYVYVKNKSKHELVQQGFDDCPIIHSNWKEYKRQVISYKDPKTRHRIVWIHYIHESTLGRHTGWKNNWVLISGGCSKYWYVRYDTFEDEFLSYVIN